ncbi:MAG: glycosyltransferase family 4 protein [Acidimicrobiia bacterium]
MRLLLVTNDYPPTPGGIQMYLKNFVDAFDGEVLVYGPDNDDAGVEEGVVRGSRGYMLPTKDTAADVIAAAQSFQPDAILFGAPHPLPKMGPALREALGAPFAVLSHGAEVTLPSAAPGVRQTPGRMLAAADIRFAVSRFTASKVERLSGRPVAFLGAGVETETFVPAENRSAKGRPVIGCVSRFVPRKGQQRLLDAVAELDRDVEVLLVGKGRTEGALRRQADKLGLDVRFEVDVPWSSLPGLYQEMDVFCMPTSSRWGGLEVEGLGLVYLEASASGLPVLAGDSGGSPETVLPGVTGYVVSSVGDIVEGLELVLGDPALGVQMGREGRRFVESEFTWDRVVERFHDEFDAHLR